MNEQENFFSPNHKQLLSLAIWAKYIAWVVLVAYILLSGIEIIQFQNTANFNNQNSLGVAKSNLLDFFRLAINILTTSLKGIVYYLVLKGISLGLNMIVETDINYREQERYAQ